MSKWRAANGVTPDTAPQTPEARALEAFRIQQDLQAGRVAAARERGAIAGIDLADATATPSVLNRPPAKWAGTYQFTDPSGLEIEIEIGRGAQWPAQLVRLTEEDGGSVVELTEQAIDAGWRLTGRV